jgi:hypothetical protein
LASLPGSFLRLDASNVESPNDPELTFMTLPDDGWVG